jgi:hypothetical protein
MATRTLTTRDGRRIETTMDDRAAAAICEGMRSNFPRDLAGQFRAGRRLTETQLAWLHILAAEELERRRKDRERETAGRAAEAAEAAARPILAGLDGLVALFARAGEHLKAPALRLAAGGRPVVIARAGSGSRHAGQLLVTDGRPYGESRYYGRVDGSGAFVPGRDHDDAVLDLLRRLAADPAKIGAEQGQLSGRCCFCGQDLTTPESTAVGYGPVCARHWRLPWGKIVTDLTAPQAVAARPRKARTTKADRERAARAEAARAEDAARLDPAAYRIERAPLGPGHVVRLVLPGRVELVGRVPDQEAGWSLIHQRVEAAQEAAAHLAGMDAERRAAPGEGAGAEEPAARYRHRDRVEEVAARMGVSPDALRAEMDAEDRAEADAEYDANDPDGF